MGTIIATAERKNLLECPKQEVYGKQNSQAHTFLDFVTRWWKWIAIVLIIATVLISAITVLALTYRTKYAADTTEAPSNFCTECNSVTISSSAVESFVNPISTLDTALNTANFTVVSTNDTEIKAKENKNVTKGYEQTVTNAPQLKTSPAENPPATTIGYVLVKDGPTHNPVIRKDAQPTPPAVMSKSSAANQEEIRQKSMNATNQLSLVEPYDSIMFRALLNNRKRSEGKKIMLNGQTVVLLMVRQVFMLSSTKFFDFDYLNLTGPFTFSSFQRRFPPF